MLDKFSEETWSDLKLAVAWCVSAKTSLSNIYGFSPFQLAISTNPKLISMISNRAPTLTKTTSSNIQQVEDNTKQGEHSLPVKILKRSGKL